MPSGASLNSLIDEWSISEAEPATQPVSLAELRMHTRVFVDESVSPAVSDDDTALELYAAIATRASEDYTEKLFITRTVTASRDDFARTLYLPSWPVQSVTSVEYRDSDGNTQTIDAANYTADLNKDPASITFRSAYDFPSTDDEPNAITVTFVAGYGSASDVPQAVRGAILLHTGTLFEHRESVAVGTVATQIPDTLERLLWPYRRLGM